MDILKPLLIKSGIIDKLGASLISSVLALYVTPSTPIFFLSFVIEIIFFDKLSFLFSFPSITALSKF